jgi:hypothetical protein
MDDCEFSYTTNIPLKKNQKKKKKKREGKKRRKKKITPPSQILCFILARVPRKSTGTTIGAAAQRGPVGRAGRQSVSPVAPILWAYHQLGEHTVPPSPACGVVFFSRLPSCFPLRCPTSSVLLPPQPHPPPHTHTHTSSQ